jgi:hypothetical protein
LRGDSGVVIGDGFTKPPQLAIDAAAIDLREESLIAADLRVIRAIDQLRACGEALLRRRRAYGMGVARMSNRTEETSRENVIVVVIVG